jgi:hypothetical protein
MLAARGKPFLVVDTIQALDFKGVGFLPSPPVRLLKKHVGREGSTYPPRWRVFNDVAKR